MASAGRRARQSSKNVSADADQLIAIAVARQLKAGEVFEPQAGTYDAFCAGFLFQETEDQLRSMTMSSEIFSWSAHGPARLWRCRVWKTEVALRAAFVAAMEGQQVAVVVPTTLLARQHSGVQSAFLRTFR